MKTKEELQEILKQAGKNRQEITALIRKLKKLSSHNLDAFFHHYHEKIFEEIDCLVCANCCKTTGPRLLNADINRIAKTLHLKPSDFSEKYLRLDEDGDYVFKQMPCPFLDDENYCQIYENRPTACREYPHTNRSRMYQILDLTSKNALVCPAVFLILSQTDKQIS